MEEDAPLIEEGLVFKAHRRAYHSTLGWRVIKKKEKALRLRNVLPGGSLLSKSPILSWCMD
jgi:hypothetical protein